MALQIDFEAVGADRGCLRVRGLAVDGAEVLVAIQRLADARYLTMHGHWDQAASWYPCPRLDADDGATRFAVGAALTAGIRAAGRDPLRACLRHREGSDAGPLAVPDPDHDAPAPTRPQSAGAAPPPAAHAAPGAVDGPVRTGRGPAASDRSRAADPIVATIAVPLPRTPRAALLGVCLLGVITLGWWWYRSAPGPVAVGTTGKTLAADLKRQQLPPADLFRRAEAAEQAGDCEAAIRLFVAAAQQDPTLAAGLAQRYDPAHRQPSPCFTAPKPDSAMEWYLLAAEAGVPQAQRRYGELLLDDHPAGPVYRAAVAWLRKAAAAGDPGAADRLAALGER